MLSAVLASADPLPQTAYQQARFAAVAEQARKASDAARPALLAALDDGDFRSELAQRAPTLANSTASALLARLKAEQEVVEVATGFPAEDARGTDWGWWSFSLYDGRNSSALLNQWEVRVKHNGSFEGGKGWFSIQDDLEVGIYGLRPFAAHAQPRTAAEARERGIYSLLNTAGADMPGGLYGDVSAVLSNNLLRDNLLVSAIDTGEWSGLCNSSSAAWAGLAGRPAPPHGRVGAGRQGQGGGPEGRAMPPGWPGPYSPVCGATNHSLGTLEHHDHLVLENLRYWNRSVPEVLARRFEALSGPWGGARLSGIDYFTYFEAMPAAQLQFPRAVKFLLGSFPSLFGTRLGRQLQAWCVERGWVLLWSLGLNLGPEVEVDFFTIGFANGTFAANQRLADPAVLPRVGVSNVSVPPAAAALFADAWEQAAAMRHNASKNASSWGVSNTSWARLWTATRDALPRGLSVEILRAGACADVDRCVGVSLSDGPSRPCLCYDAS